MTAQLHLRRAQPSEAIALKDWICDRHYLEDRPAGFVSVFEYVMGQRIGGVILGRPNAPSYDPDRILEVTRFYFEDGTERFVESRGLALLRKHVRTWLRGIRLLLAYSDPDQGHEGTIYDADGWACIGKTDGAWGKGWNSRAGRSDKKVSKKLRWVRTP